MELVLLALALIGLLPVAALHVGLLVVHAGVGLWIAWRLLSRQPLTAQAIAVYVVMYFPNPVAVLMGWVPPDSTDEVLYRANVLMMVGFDIFILAARRLRVTRKDANRMPRLQLQHFTVDVCIVGCFAVSALGLAVLIATAGATGMNVFGLSKHVYSGAGEHTRYYLAARYCVMLLPLAAFLIGLKRLIAQMPYLAAVAALLLMHFLIFRNRQVPMGVLVGYATAVVAKNYFVTFRRRRVRRGLPFYMKPAVFVAVPLVLVLGVSIKYIRESYVLHDFAIRHERVERLLVHTFSGGDLGQSLFVRKALTLFPDSHPFLNGLSYYRLFFAPIPRSFWPDKPENTQRIFARVLDPELGRKNITIPAGLVGDQYINFGYAGVLCMIVLGFLFGNERYRGLTDLMFFAGSGLWLFQLMRGAVANSVVPLFAVWIAAAIITRIVRPVVLPRRADLREAPANALPAAGAPPHVGGLPGRPPYGYEPRT